MIAVHSTSTSIYGHAGKFLSGMTGNVLVAVVFHAAIGGVLWLGGSLGDARPAFPVSDVIMVQVIPTLTMPDTVSSVQEVMEPEPEPDSEPVSKILNPEPKTETSEVPEPEILAVNIEPSTQRVFDTPPAPVFEEDVAVELPVYELPKKKPAPQPVALDEPPIDVVQIEKITDPALRQTAPTAIRFPQSPLSIVQQGQASGVEQQVQNNLISTAQVKYATNPKPVYPTEARRRRQEGIVLLHVEVGVDGRVKAVRVKTSSGHRLLDRAAKRAIAGWIFVPATLSGIPVQSTAEVPVRFFLRDT